MPSDEPADSTASSPGSMADLAPGAVRVERGVEGLVERPGHAGQPVGEVAAQLDVDLVVGVDEAEGDPFRADGEILLAQAGQPGHLPAGGAAGRR